MPQGRIAFLVLAHADPTMVARLVRRLLPYGRVFVHIDGKAPLAPFEAALPSEATLLRERVRVSWGGFSMVEATLRLLREAERAAPEAERFVLLSGQDYPARPLEEFVAMLDFRPTHEFARAFDLLASERDRNKVLHARRLDDVLPYRPRGPLGKGVAFLNRLARKVDRETARYRQREFPFPLRPVAGSQWWAFTRPMVEHILRFVDENPAFVRFYRRTFAPDELFFQTIAHNSPLAANLDPVLPPTDNVTHVANVHLIHESLGKTYALEDLDEILDSGRWFFRKATTVASTPLLDELDRQAGLPTPLPRRGEGLG